MDLDLTGHRAVVTGASVGIGGETVRALAEHGADVAFCASHARRHRRAGCRGRGRGRREGLRLRGRPRRRRCHRAVLRRRRSRPRCARSPREQRRRLAVAQLPLHDRRRVDRPVRAQRHGRGPPHPPLPPRDADGPLGPGGDDQHGGREVPGCGPGRLRRHEGRARRRHQGARPQVRGRRRAHQLGDAGASPHRDVGAHRARDRRSRAAAPTRTRSKRSSPSGRPTSRSAATAPRARSRTWCCSSVPISRRTSPARPSTSTAGSARTCTDHARGHRQGPQRGRTRRNRDHRGRRRIGPHGRRADPHPEVALSVARVRRARDGAHVAARVADRVQRRSRRRNPATTSSTASARTRCSSCAVDDGELRAYPERCRHRGNIICEGAGTGSTELRCVYHRWCWDLQGRLREVPSRKGFGMIRNDDFPLLPRVGRHVGPDGVREPRPRRRCRSPTTSRGSPTTSRGSASTTSAARRRHRAGAGELEGRLRRLLRDVPRAGPAPRDDGLDRRHRRAAAGAGAHTSKSAQHYGVPSPRLRPRRRRPDRVGLVHRHPGRPHGDHRTVPGPASCAEGETVADAIAERVRGAKRQQGGADLSGFDTTQMLELHQYNVFPNATILIMPDLLSVIVARPGADVEHAEMVMINFVAAASADAPRTQPFDVTLGPDQADFGFVLNAGHAHCLRRAARSAPARPHAPHAVERGVPHHQHAPQPGAVPGHRPRRLRREGGGHMGRKYQVISADGHVETPPAVDQVRPRQVEGPRASPREAARWRRGLVASRASRMLQERPEHHRSRADQLRRRVVLQARRLAERRRRRRPRSACASRTRTASTPRCCSRRCSRTRFLEGIKDR